MNALLSLNCPNCGGRLGLNTVKMIYECEFCGNVYTTEGNQGQLFLERYNQCPLCKRNDQVKKLSAMFLKNPQMKKSFRHRVLLSMAPKLMKKPEEPRVTGEQKQGYGCLIIGVLLLGASIYILSALETSDVFMTVLMGVIGLVLCLVWLMNFNQSKKEKEQRAEKLASYKASLDQYQQYLQSDQALTSQRLAIVYSLQERIAQKRWASLYYCERDDIVYIPGEDSYSSIADINELLYKI